MGTLKQLLFYSGKTLLQHSIDEAADAGFCPIVVVVGSGAEEIRRLVSGAIQIVENKKWQTGMGSSIVAGMRALLNHSEPVSAVALLVADQPLVKANHLSAMLGLLGADAEIVAAEYSGTVGVPALFTREWFEALLALSPEEGARTLLRGGSTKIARFPLPEAAVDLDTREDFENFTSAVQSRRT
ncbi:MAG: nucleotidyltransferase family protein [Acidobacteriaceae bacterium]|nr:nucleotidyltransferase family protein [Acidobacteriaceae bacterium]